MRGKSGPDSSTPNEEGRTRAGGQDKGIPKTGKTETGGPLH